jgi:hypothetical protein
MAVSKPTGSEPDDPRPDSARTYEVMLAIERAVVAPAAEARLDMTRVRALGAELGQRSAAFAAEHGHDPAWVLKKALEDAERAIFAALEDAAQGELRRGEW